MIAFRTLPNDQPELAASPLLRAELLTLRYAQEHGAIGPAKTLAFERVFVHGAGSDDVAAPRQHLCAKVGLRGSTRGSGHVGG